MGPAPPELDPTWSVAVCESSHVSCSLQPLPGSWRAVIGFVVRSLVIAALLGAMLGYIVKMVRAVSLSPAVSPAILLRVPAVCMDELYRYALSIDLLDPASREKAKQKVLALKRGEAVTVRGCTVQVEE